MRLRIGEPQVVLLPSADRGQRFDSLAVLCDEPGGIAVGGADLLRHRDGVSVGARQQLDDEGRPVAQDGLAAALEHLHLAALDVDLDGAHVAQA